MFGRLRERMSFANTMSLIAVFVALGGTSYAAVKIPRNSVSSAQIKTGGVGSSEVKNGALRLGDFRTSELNRMSDLPGMKGDKGDPGTNGTNGEDGEDGEDGTATAFARVAFDGTLQPNIAGFPPQVKGTIAITRMSDGIYCFDLPFRPASAMVTVDNADLPTADRNVVATVAIDRGEDLGDCPADRNDARVRTVDGETNLPMNVRFFIWFEG